MNSFYKLFFTVFSLLISSAVLMAQSYDTPCEAETNPVDGWGDMTETMTLNGDFSFPGGNTPWITDDAGGATQNWGFPGKDSSLFYKLEISQYATSIEFEYTGGDAANVSIALFGVTSTECGGGTTYGEVLYQDPDMTDMLVEDFIGESPVTWNLCGFDVADYQNLYLWLGVEEADVGTVDLEVTQQVAPYNDLCEDPSDPNRGAGDLGVLSYNDQVGEGLGCTAPGGWTADQTNEFACPIEFDITGGNTCLEEFENEPTVWYTFETGPDVELIDLTVEHSISDDLRVGVFEMTVPCGAGGLLFPAIPDADDYCDSGSDLIEMENLTVKPSTQYFIAVSTPQADWGEFDICLEVCEPPANNKICDATDVDFPGPAADPDDPAETLTGQTTECAYGFYQNPDLSAMEDFDCGSDFQNAVFYKLNVDDYATKMTITSGGLSTGGSLSAQVFILNSSDCPTKAFDYLIPADPDFNECDLEAADLEIDLCGIDNAEYDNLYLWVASTKADAGEFDLEFFQEIAPENDLCSDPSSPDREARDLGVLSYNDQTGEGLGCTEPAGWSGPQTNRGACPAEFDFNVTACFDGHEDDPSVWYTFETGADVELIDLTVEHAESSDLRVSIFEMDNPCGAGNAVFPGTQDQDDYCDSGSDLIEFEDLTVKPNTQYFILVSTPIEEWGEFDICLEVCEPPTNNQICDATDIDYPDLGSYNPDDPIETLPNETTECAYGFFQDVDLNSMEDFGCGAEFENAVFYKLNVDDYATKLRITSGGLSTGGALSTQVFIMNNPPDCPTKTFDYTIPANPDFNECDLGSGNDLEIDLCDIDNAEYDNLYLWVASTKVDAGEFDLEFFQEIAPENDLCEDPGSPDREARDLGVLAYNDQTGEGLGCTEPAGWSGPQTNRGACPFEFNFNISPCFDAHNDDPAVWYTFETGPDVEEIDLTVEHFESSDLRVSVFEMETPCMAGNILFPGSQDQDDYCDSGSDLIEFEDLTVKPSTTYFILVSTPIEEWGEFDICLEVCEPPANNKICDAEDVDFPALGDYDPDDPVVPPVNGTTVCAYGFYDDADLGSLIDFDCGDDFENAVFYKLNIDYYATELTINVDGLSTGGQLAAQVFFYDGTPDCVARGYSADILVPADPAFEECDFDGSVEMEMDLCDIDNEDYENMYLWIATNKEDAGEFNLEFFQEVAPLNDECEQNDGPEAADREATDLGTIDVGNASGDCDPPAGWEPQTNRGACPEPITGDPCFEGFQDEASVWYSFETGDDVELITVDVNHSEADEVRLALFEMPTDCAFPANTPPGQDIEEYCQGDVVNDGVDSVWNLLVQENTKYFVLVSTDKDEWGEFEICVKNCEPPENDRVCDVEGDTDFHITPGEEVDYMDRNPNIIEGTTVCANNFFVDFDLGFENFGCDVGEGAESAVFYKIDLHERASELTIIANEIDPLNVLSYGLFFLGDPCDGDRRYDQQPWQDPEGNLMVECNALDNELVFNTCGMSEEDRDNVWLWVATERKDQGEFELEISQKVAPENDECQNAEDFGRLSSDENDITCVERTNLFACPEYFDPMAIDVPPGQDPNCYADPVDPERAGVWFRFDTDSEAGRLDMTAEHFNGENVNISMYQLDPDCENLSAFLCEEDEDNDGLVEFEDFQIEPNETYLVLIHTEKGEVQEGEFEMCINVKPPIECEGNPPPFYNQTEIICGLNALNGYCLDMGGPNAGAGLNWPGCEGCCVFHNPSWFTFVAGAEELEIEVFISECQNNVGVQISLYELSCEVDFDPDNPDQLEPTPDQLVSDCSYASSGQIGSVFFNTDTDPGAVYGIVVDGFSGDICNVEVEEVLVGGDPPELDGTELEEPSFDDTGMGFDGDTICEGATDVPFILEGEVEGACGYRWTIDGEEIPDSEGSLEEFIDFPEAGTYDVCVSATNLCNETDPVCIEVVVEPLEPYVTHDTICEGDDYVWVGPFGEELDPTPPINSDVPGDFEYESTAFNQYDCTVPADLYLHIINENDENPTQIDTFACYDDAISGNFSYYCETLIEPDVYDQECVSPFTGCDTFFTIDFKVLGGPFEIDPACTGNGEMGFFFLDPELGGYTPWLEQFAIYQNDPDFDIEYEWTITNDPVVLGTDQNVILPQDTIEKYANNGILNLELNITIYYQDEVVCEAESPPFFFNLSENFPDIVSILGDTSYCPGQPELEIYSEYEDPIFPAPNGDPDPVFLVEWTKPDGFEYVAPTDMNSDTIILSAPNDPTDSTLCLKVYTERCFFTDSTCLTLNQEDPVQPDLGPDAETCDTVYTFDPLVANSGAWTLIDTPAAGNTLTFANEGDPNTQISVSEPGTYTFEWREGPISCARYDTMSVTFLENPFALNYADTCYDLDFVVDIEIAGGAGGYSIHPDTDIDGELNGNIFTSDTITIDFDTNYGDTLYLVVEDANGCLTDSIPVVLVCECESEIGTMAQDTIELCEGESAFPDYQGGHENDGNDTLMYVLHTGDTAELGTVIDTSLFDDGEVTYNPNVNFDQIYYISMVIGNINDDVYVDLSDPCLAVSIGQPVVWRQNPVANAGIDTTVCGFEYSLNATSSVGNGLWEVIPDTGGVDFSDPTDPNAMVTVDEAGSYTFRWTEDNQGCVDSDEVEVTLTGEISFRVFYECNATATEFQAFIIFEGGGGDYFEVTNFGTFNGDTLVTDWAPKGDQFFVEVDNDLGCGPVEVNVTTECICETDIGTLDTANFFTACSDGCIDATGNYDPTGEFFDGNDVASYILHDTQDTLLGNVIGQRPSGEFCYQDFAADIDFEDTLYISYVIGNAGGGGNVDLTDECLKISYGIPVLFYELPVADAGADHDECGFTGSLSATLSTGGDGTWSYVDGPSGNVVIDDENAENTGVTVEDYGIHSFEWTEDNNGCVDRDTVLLDFLSSPEIDTNSIVIECDDIAETYTVTFDIVLGDENSLVVDGTEGTLTGRTFVSDSIDSGDGYSFEVSDGNACDTFFLDDSHECPCLTEIGSLEGSALDLCEGETVSGLNYNTSGEFRDGNDELRWVLLNDMDSILFERMDQGFSFDPDTMVLGETYYVRVYLGSVKNGEFQYDEDCTLSDGDIPVIWWEEPVADAGADRDECGLSAELRAQFSTVSTDGRWSYAGGPSANVDIIDVNSDTTIVNVEEFGEHDFIWREDNNGCVDQDLVTINFQSTPEVDPASVEIECDDIAETYTVTFDILMGEESTLQVDGTPGTLTGRTFVSDPIPSGDGYTFTVSDGNACGNSVLDDSFECPCLTEIGSITGSELNLCEDETIQSIGYDPSGEFRDGNDELRFVLLDEDDNILFERMDAEFSFDQGSMNLGETYYVRVYLGSVKSGDFQYSEDCTLSDGDIPVTWWAYPEAVAVPEQDEITCTVTEIGIDGSGSIGDRLSYEWTTNNGEIVDGTADQAEVRVTAAGTYTLVVTDELSGCSDEISVDIGRSADIPVAEIADPGLLTCAVNEIVLDGSGSESGPTIEYEWTTSDGNIVSDPTANTITVDAVGTYRLTVFNTANSCEESRTVTVTADRETPDVAAQSLGILSCSLEEVTVSGEGSSEGAIYTYSWTTDDGNIISGTTSRDIQVDDAGVYQLVVTNTENGCVDSTSATVEFAENELAGIEVEARDPICHGEINGIIEITPISGTDPITYTLVGVDENQTGVFNNLGPGTYNIEVTDANGCLETEEVELIDPPIVSIDLSESIVVEAGDSVVVDAFLPPQSILDTLIWDTDTVPYRCLDSSCTSILLTPPETMTVTATAVGGVNCTDQDNMRIIVKVFRDVYIPNIFTPNGDGINDVFLPETGRRVTQVDLLQVYDRWGERLFESRNFMTGDTQFGWDGTFNGERMPPGVYAYKVEVTYDNGETEQIHGTVTLMR